VGRVWRRGFRRQIRMREASQELNAVSGVPTADCHGESCRLAHSLGIRASRIANYSSRWRPFCRQFHSLDLETISTRGLINAAKPMRFRVLHLLVATTLTATALALRSYIPGNWLVFFVSLGWFSVITWHVYVHPDP